MVSQDANCSADVVRRIVRSLNKIWEAEDISKATKVLLYRSMVQAIALYNSETYWTVISIRSSANDHHHRAVAAAYDTIFTCAQKLTKWPA